MLIPTTHRAPLTRLSPLLFALALVACGTGTTPSTTTSSSSGSGGDIGAGGMPSTGSAGGMAGAGGSSDPAPILPMGTSLLLQVLDTSGKAIPSAAVSYQGSVLPTNGAGYLLLENLAPGHFVAKVESSGYAPASVVVDLPEDAHGGAEVYLHPLGAPLPFDATAGAALDQGPVHLTIPPGALVDHNGRPVTGTVEATIVAIDPTTQLDTMPGPLEATAAANSEIVSLESFAMAEVSLWQNGLPIQIAPGKRATLELVLPDAIASKTMIGETIPAWWFDLDAGLWREESFGVVQSSMAIPTKLAWVAEVSHFTWWNCDKPWTERNCFDVSVVDSNGNPAPGVAVGATGIDYTGQSQTKLTDAHGHTCIEIKLGGTAEILVGTKATKLASTQVTGSGPAGACTGQGAACIPVTIKLPEDAHIWPPGAYLSCPYTGPAGTEGVGICKAGVNYCNTIGSAFIGCTGEVLPETETCTTPFDDDCDGETNEPGTLDCACEAGQVISCYSGPPGKLGVGACKAGTQTCGGFPQKYGPCIGEVLPRLETCATADDDDCDGSNDCSATISWSKRFGDDSSQLGSGVSVDAGGNIVLSGQGTGAFDLGGGFLPDTGSTDIVVARFDANGNHLWSKRFLHNSDQSRVETAIDKTGNILLAGSVVLEVDFGGGPLTGMGSMDIFVAKLDPNGNHLWSKRFGDSDNQFTADIAVDGAGNVVLIGGLYGTIDFGGGPLTSAGQDDIVIAKFDPNGNHIWSKRFGDSSYQFTGAVAIDGIGNIVLVGYGVGPIDLGGGLRTCTGIYDVFIAKLDPNGNHLWSKCFGNTGFLESYTVAIDKEDNIVLPARGDGTVDFGGGPLTSVGTYDNFLAKLNPDGNHLWSKRFGDDNAQFKVNVAVDSLNNIVLTTHSPGTMDFGGGPLTSAGGKDIFVARLDAEGNHLWSNHFGDAYNQSVQSTAVDGAGNIILTGNLWGSVDFGNGLLTSAGSYDIFLAKLAP